MKRRNDKGQFIAETITTQIKDGIITYYQNGEVLFFTEVENAPLFEGRSMGKYADGYSIVRDNGKYIAVHRFLTNAKKGDIVDHINRNKKDNRVANLRITDKSVNALNSKMRKDNTSGCRGVWYRKDTGKWVAEIIKNSKKIGLGHFADKQDAINARRQAEAMYYGD